ncbi:MAG: alcohol dehydrogenase catalytic domain-containing protein [Alphaproteobacteria bacterium]|nr:alcohol dehydrogenase catalytic domain-containing protein [Alphaproteobacteria bacterium]
MDSRVTVVYADREPMPGIINPGSHQLFRNPRISVETRTLNALHPEEIRVQMCYAGICGTDVHLVDRNPDTGYIRCSAPLNIPIEGRVIGHEGVGKVIETGASIRHVRTGDYVTFESIIICHCCDMCRKGKFNQCRHAQLLGLETDGIFGSVVDVPGLAAHNVTNIIQEDNDIMSLACVEPAGVAYVACQNAVVSAGDIVVVFGAGPIGLFSAILCTTVFGASTVYVVDPVAFRRRVAEKWSGHVYDTEEFFSDLPNDIDVVIESSGDLENINKIFRNLNANGRVVLLARTGNHLALSAVDYMITNRISITGSRGHLGGAYNDIFKLYRNMRFPLNAAITGVVNGGLELVNLLKSREAILYENCKVLVKFE